MTFYKQVVGKWIVCGSKVDSTQMRKNLLKWMMILLKWIHKPLWAIKCCLLEDKISEVSEPHSDHLVANSTSRTIGGLLLQGPQNSSLCGDSPKADHKGRLHQSPTLEASVPVLDLSGPLEISFVASEALRDFDRAVDSVIVAGSLCSSFFPAQRHWSPTLVQIAQGAQDSWKQMPGSNNLASVTSLRNVTSLLQASVSSSGKWG